MRVLFVHTNFPGQFGKLAEALQGLGHDVRALRPSDVQTPSPVPVTECAPIRSAPTWHQNLLTARFEADVQRGLSAKQAAASMAASGFAPDLIIGHPAYGEMLFLAEIWPRARRIIYAENYTSPNTLTAKFDPEFPAPSETELLYARTQSAAATLTLMDADHLVSPTAFQRATFPEALQSRIEIIPDGVDSNEVRPQANAAFAIPDTDITIHAGDEIITYVNRHLEPVRGIHVFLRALALALAERPKARALIIGAPHAQHYGRPPPRGQTWIEIFMREVGPRLDMSRVHFLRTIDRSAYLGALSVSAAHIYLTYPFVLSWSVLEAMAAGCLVIGSDTAPVREFLENDRNGMLVDFFDHAALAHATSAALAQPDAYAALRTQARADAIARTDWNTVALPRWLALINAIASQGARA